jgi:hypothetical protein
LTGAPATTVNSEDLTDDAKVQATYDNMKAYDDAGYLTVVGTDGGGNDQETNSCGIAMSHAYAVPAVFTLTEADGTKHEVIMVRNPWGKSTYNKDWHKADPKWTDALVAQVPLGADPRTDLDTKGIFIVPKALIKVCFGNISTAHIKEGYSDNWHDVLDTDE